MVSLQQPTYGVMQTNAMAEIDPGPPVSTTHESAYSLRTSSPQMTESTTATRAARLSPASSHRPAEQEHVLLFGDQTTGIGWDGKLARGTNGSHQVTKEAKGGIAFGRPEYSCPFALGFPGAIPLDETFGTSRHLRTYLSGMSVKCLRGPLRGPQAMGKGSEDDRIRGQAGSQTSPDMLPPTARHRVTTRPLDDATSLGRGEHVLPGTTRPAELFRRSYDAVVIGPGHSGDVARACTSRAGENVCAPKGEPEQDRYDWPKVEQEAAEEQNRSKKSAHKEFGDASGGGDTPGISHLISGKGQHAGLRSAPNGINLLNAHGLLEQNHDALRMKTCLKEMRSNLSDRDNVTKPETSGEARIDEVEKSFNVKGKTSMEISSDNSLIDRSERVVKNLVDAENSRPQPELRRPRLNIASTLPPRTSTTSFRAIGIREQRSMDPSYSTQFMMLEAKRCVGLPTLTSWATSPQTNSSVGATDVSMRDALMWMMAYNLIASPSESEYLPRLLNQSAQLLLNLVAAAISCFHVQLSPMVERTNARAKQCTGTVHCLLEDPG